MGPGPSPRHQDTGWQSPFHNTDDRRRVKGADFCRHCKSQNSILQSIRRLHNGKWSVSLVDDNHYIILPHFLHLLPLILLQLLLILLLSTQVSVRYHIATVFHHNYTHWDKYIWKISWILSICAFRNTILILQNIRTFLAINSMQRIQFENDMNCDCSDSFIGTLIFGWKPSTRSLSLCFPYIIQCLFLFCLLSFWFFLFPINVDACLSCQL